MLNKENEAHIEMFSHEFYNEFKAAFPLLIFEYDLSKNYIIRIPAVNAEFGDIKIVNDFNEITVLLGEYFHTHFERASYEDDIFDSTVRKQIITDTISFISDVLSDKVVLRVEKRGNRLLSSSIVYLGETESGGYTALIPVSGLFSKFFSRNKEIELNTWSRAYKKE